MSKARRRHSPLTATLKQVLADIKYESDMAHRAVEALQWRIDKLSREILSLKRQHDPLAQENDGPPPQSPINDPGRSVAAGLQTLN